MTINAGVPCRSYHAGLKAEERSQVLADWTCGRLPVVSATVAFGMGIDKAGKSPASKTDNRDSLHTAVEPPWLFVGCLLWRLALPTQDSASISIPSAICQPRGNKTRGGRV